MSDVDKNIRQNLDLDEKTAKLRSMVLKTLDSGKDWGYDAEILKQSEVVDSLVNKQFNRGLKGATPLL